MNPPSPEPNPAASQTRWFLEEVQPHDSQLKAYLHRSFPQMRDVDDVVQESYLRVWKARAAQPILSAKAFLFTVARHVALNLVDRGRSSPVAAVEDLDALPVIDDGQCVTETVSRNEKVRLLVEALAALPPRCRVVTILRKLRAVPQKDIASQLGISEKTVEEQVSRGVRRCETYLRRRGIVSFHDR